MKERLAKLIKEAQERYIYAEEQAQYLIDNDVDCVKHGEWKAYPDEHEICATEFACSCCGESFCTSELTDEDFLLMMKFCPNCGAKIKGGEG